MLELRNYSKKEIAELIKCNERDVQAIQRKLKSYGVAYTYDRWTATFTITGTGDLFKQLCVWDYSLPPNIDYDKFALYAFLVLVANEEGVDFNSMPLERMEEELLERYPDLATSRQTLAKYQENLGKMGIASCDIENPIYVIADTTSGSKEYTPTDGKTYLEAWKYYFSQKELYLSDPETAEWASAYAYKNMVKEYGGHPKKHYPMIGNACNEEATNIFIDLVTDKVTKSKIVSEDSCALNTKL